MTDLNQVTSILADLNYYENVDAADCPFIQISNQTDDTDKLLASSTTNSCFCQQMYSLIVNVIGDTFFDIIRPMLLGKLVYTPNTTEYNTLIKQVNVTYSNIDKFGRTMGDLSNLIKQINTQLQSINNQYNITAVLQTLDQITNNALNLSSIDLATITSQLEFLTQFFGFIRNSIYCADLNKFIGVSNEDEAVNLGLKLMSKKAFYAAVVFQTKNAENPNLLPKVVKYKIRMNSSYVPNTENNKVN